jgi:hypothetical protein
MADRHSEKTVKREVEKDREDMKKHGDQVDIAGDDSFPASDPPSFIPVKGEKKNDIKKKTEETAKSRPL